MSDPVTLKQIDEYRQHFDAMYVGGIPNLLNDDGAFLSFLAVLAGTEALAGLCAPAVATGERFRSFVAAYYPQEYQPHVEHLWAFRNAIVHAFNPGPFGLTHHNSRVHLKASQEVVMLNAEDFFADFLFAARHYFDALTTNAALQANFLKRVTARDGGAPQVWVVQNPSQS